MEKETGVIRKLVREGYGRAVRKKTSGCSSDSCCGRVVSASEVSRRVGYSEADLRAVPEKANLGFGCGNPVAIAEFRAGDVVLDLGSGAGFDVFLAARKVGPAGRVIGVDMTPEMVRKARRNARKGHFTNVEFRLGEIETLPIEDESIDVIISNCVINLSPEKRRVFHDAFRVLKPGGRLIVSDLVLEKRLPKKIRASLEAYLGCLTGAIRSDDYLDLIRESGFTKVEIVGRADYQTGVLTDNLAGSISSLKVRAVKPFGNKRGGGR